MTLEEFSNEFDVLLNSYSDPEIFSDKKVIKLDEYEKSIFLTRAQEEIVLGLYNGTLKSPYESTEELRKYLNNLVYTETITDANPEKGLFNNSYIYDLNATSYPVWFVTYEQVLLNDDALECGTERYAKVVPTTHDEVFNIVNNPFKGPNKDRVLRLDLAYNKVELISKYNIEEYTIRYVKELEPIILIDLPDGLSINNNSNSKDCELHSALHKDILRIAVKLAIESKTK